MNIIHRNILEICEGVIVHQVNNKRVMGAGLAKQIRNKYPQHYNDYLKHPLRLGSCVSTTLRNLTIVGIVAQDGYGRDRRYTDYAAFEECLKLLAKAHQAPIYIPYNIGCGLAGGDWSIISQLIEQYLPTATICKL